MKSNVKWGMKASASVSPFCCFHDLLKMIEILTGKSLAGFICGISCIWDSSRTTLSSSDWRTRCSCFQLKYLDLLELRNIYCRRKLKIWRLQIFVLVLSSNFEIQMLLWSDQGQCGKSPQTQMYSSCLTAPGVLACHTFPQSPLAGCVWMFVWVPEWIQEQEHLSLFSRPAAPEAFDISQSRSSTFHTHLSLSLIPDLFCRARALTDCGWIESHWSARDRL